MPYNNEYANPRGHEALLQSQLIQERLATYSFQVPQADSQSIYELKETKLAKDLPSSMEVGKLREAIAIDGSIAKVSTLAKDDVSELAAIKIGFVKQDLERFRELASQKTISLNEYHTIYENTHQALVLPGKGVYTKSSSEWLWQDKLREEIFFFFKNLAIPFSVNETLLELYKSLVSEDKMFTCFFCWTEKGLKENIAIINDYSACPNCYRDIYITDALFLDIHSTDSSLYTSLMLTIERIFFYGLVREYEGDLDETIFLIDGPLALFKNYSLNTGFLKTFQALPTFPAIAGFEKTGTWADFSLLPQVQAQLVPGTVAMITTELDQALGQRHTFVTNPYFYGKRFIYRTLDGNKTFVFMTPPRIGNPYKLSENDVNADYWENYPHVRLLCDFIEENATDRFSITSASLDIIAEANHEASLPKTLSENLLLAMLSSANTDY